MMFPFRRKGASAARRRSTVELSFESLESRQLLAGGLSPQERLLATVRAEVSRQTERQTAADSARQISNAARQEIEAARDASRQKSIEAVQAIANAAIARLSGDTQAVSEAMQAAREDRSAASELLRIANEIDRVAKAGIRAETRLESTFERQVNRTERDIAKGRGAPPSDLAQFLEETQALYAERHQQLADQSTGRITSFEDQIANQEKRGSGGRKPPVGEQIQLPAEIKGLIGSLIYQSDALHEKVTLPMEADFTIDKNGTINGNAKIVYVISDQGSELRLNSTSGKVSGTYKPGFMQSQGGFSFHFPAYTASDGSHAEFDVNVTWKGSLSNAAGSDVFKGKVYSNNQELGEFELSNNPH